MSQEIKYILESLLFVASDPLSIEQMKRVVNVSESRVIREALKALGEEYEARGGAFFLKAVAGGYQIRTRPEYGPWIKRLLQPAPVRLSKAAMETLAIVAYKQPVIRSDIEHIRGVDCGGVLRMLMEKKLIRVLGRKALPGRPLIYGTTRQFLEVFELKDLTELPAPEEVEGPETPRQGPEQLSFPEPGTAEKSPGEPHQAKKA